MKIKYYLIQFSDIGSSTIPTQTQQCTIIGLDILYNIGVVCHCLNNMSNYNSQCDDDFCVVFSRDIGWRSGNGKWNIGLIKYTSSGSELWKWENEDTMDYTNWANGYGQN